MYNFLVSFLFLFFRDPESVHRLALFFLKVLGLPPVRLIAEFFTRIDDPSLSQNIMGFYFKNPIGLAAGFDKEGRAIAGLEALGFGFVEIGTVTKHAQSGNPRPRIFRLPADRALINRMGFNTMGADAMKRHLQSSKRKVPLGISIGKSKITSLADAPEDYLYSFSVLYEKCDYFAVNVSSPNTPGLRQLQDKEFLVAIVRGLNEYRKKQKIQKPIFVKIAPDLTNEAIDEVLQIRKTQAIDGIIATNTSISREGLMTKTEEAGGVSGKPLQKRSTEIIRYIHKKDPTLFIIGVGGIFTAEDAYEKIKAGARLVQIYTGFIYGGPLIVWRLQKGLARLLRRDGFKNISEAVGAE